MNKLFITLVCAAMLALPVAAQTAEKPLSPKELKAKQKTELQEFKNKQKAELAEFIANQQKVANGVAAPAFAVEKPQLVNDGDSIAYLFGARQSNGLFPYIQAELKVDTAKYANEFFQGILDQVNKDPNDEKLRAHEAGQDIGKKIITFTEQLGKDYYAANPEKTLDPHIVANALIATLLGTSGYTVRQAGERFDSTMAARTVANREAIYGPNRVAGEHWLEENKKKEGVVTLPSGLQYKIITKGNGPIPVATDKVSVNYEGHLIDGTEFDSSYKRKEPTSFTVKQVIKGWQEALTKMPVGSKWEVYVPQELGYGDRETGKILPYSTLIFTVELLEIVK